MINRLNLKLTYIINFSIFIFIILTFFTRNQEKSVYLRIAINALIIILILYYLFKNGVPIHFSFYLIHYYIFILFSVISIFYSQNQTSTIMIVFKMIGIFVMIFLIGQYINSNENMKLIFDSYLITSILAATYYISYIIINKYYLYVINTNTTDYFRYLMFNGNNPNDVGIIFSIAVFYLFTKSSFKIRCLKHVLMTVLIIAILFTGSRKALIALLLLIFIYYYIKSKNKLIILIAITLLLVATAILMTNINFLYNMIGWRFVGILSVFSDNALVYESSANYRYKMIIDGIDLIKSRPWFGYGLDNFRYENNLGLSTYSHNNFIEVAVSVGIPGLICYYLFFINLLIQCVKVDLQRKILIVPILITFLILGFGSVQYREPYIFLFTAQAIALTIRPICNKPAIYRLP